MRKLRTGFTTGTCATAAAKAAVLFLINKKKIEQIEVDLPYNKKIMIKIDSYEFIKNNVKCTVIKDGGDDPDVTHNAKIFVTASLTKNINKIEIEGGEGVGIVTKLGLGLEVGKHAINPTPKKMITENIKTIGANILKINGLNIIISVIHGKELAKKTDNPRLGIIGGISILGTSGIVIPYSTAAFAAAIRQNIDVSIAMGNMILVLSTGSRSEEFIKKIIKLPEHCFIQMGDFAGYAIQQCITKKIRKVYIVGFIGKLTKIASGIKQTHVKGSKVDMNFLSNLAEKCNADNNTKELIKSANTARHVQDIIKKNKILGFFREICYEVYKQMQNNSEKKMEINIRLLDFNGSIIGRYP